MVRFGQLGGRDVEIPGGGGGGDPGLYQEDDAEFLSKSSCRTTTGFHQSSTLIFQLNIGVI